MTDNLPEERRDNTSIERRVDRLDVKIDRVGDQVETVGKEMRSALEMLMKQQDERWKWFEQRSDMEARNQKQAIELLTSSTVKLQQEQAATDTQLNMLERDQQVGLTKLAEQRINADHIHDEHERRISDLEGAKQWGARLLAGTIITALVSLLVALSTHHI